MCECVNCLPCSISQLIKDLRVSVILMGFRPSSLVGLGLWGNTLLLHGELKLRLTQNLRSMLPEPSSSALNRRGDWEADEERQVSMSIHTPHYTKYLI